MGWASTLEIVTRSDVGRVRTHNEDAVYVNPAFGLAILADGMGGYNAGEVASTMVTTLLATGLEQSFAASAGQLTTQEVKAALEAEIYRVNSAVYAAAQDQPQYAGMGTTLVMAMFHDKALTVAHVGDSRLYRLRGGELQLITRDHSVLQEQIDRGVLTREQARRSQHKNLVTRALGIDPKVTPEIHEYGTLPGDIYLLCSDGLNDLVEDEAIAALLRKHAADLEKAAEHLIARANDSGGHDNVSLILVRAGKCYPSTLRGWLTRLLASFK